VKRPPDLPELYTTLDSLPASQMRDMLAYLAAAEPLAFETALKEAHLLAQAAASVANPYGSYVSPYTAKSAAEVAEGLPHLHQHSGGRPECTFPGCTHGTLITAPCLVPAAHGAYPNVVTCDVPGHHFGGAA
jgi:hypothetical protein